MKTVKNISYGFYPDQVLDLYLPEIPENQENPNTSEQKPFPTFIYFHGGGFERGRDKTFGSQAAKYLTERGIAMVCVEYRRYPEAVYPEFIRDCAASVAWVYHHIESYGGNRTIYVGGSSAGGYASMMLCFDKRWYAVHKLPENAVSGYFHDAGQPTTHFNVLKERGMDPKRVISDEAAPLYHIGSSREYPPMHFVVCDNDMPARYEQTMLVLATLKHFGYNMDTITHKIVHGTHCHYIAQFDENGDSVLGKLIFEFIEKLKK